MGVGDPYEVRVAIEERIRHEATASKLPITFGVLCDRFIPLVTLRKYYVK